MKPASQCESMTEIRAEIDALDQQIIQNLGKCFEYVKAASKFKTSETGVRAPERFKAMLLQRREWAQQNGLSADVIEKMYTDLVNYFIEAELQTWKEKR